MAYNAFMPLFTNFLPCFDTFDTFVKSSHEQTDQVGPTNQKCIIVLSRQNFVDKSYMTRLIVRVLRENCEQSDEFFYCPLMT